MNKHDKTYLDTCKSLLENGFPSDDRTGTGTIKDFGLHMRFPMKHGFPLLTTKKVPIRLIELELRMFLLGITDNNFLKDQDVHIWDAFANDDGYLGEIYGAMWRRWPGKGTAHFSAAEGSWVSYERIDQIAELMKMLRENPNSRRKLVSGWNPALLPVEGVSHADNVNAGLQALPPCHTMWQVHCRNLTIPEREAIHKEKNGGRLIGSKTEEFRHQVLDRLDVPRIGVSLQLYQRSADMFLGVPFNIASYSLLLHYIAASLGMQPIDFIWNGGDCHIYNNHVEQMQTQIARLKECPASPQLWIGNPKDDLWDYTADDIELRNYFPMAAIKGAVAV